MAYVGNIGRHLNGGFNLNSAIPGPGADINLRRPLFAQFGLTDPIFDKCDCTSSNYNALQTRIEKRFTRGLQMQAHYTWSKALNYDQDYFAIQPHYGLVDFNRKHVFVLSSVYDLPFGRGKQYAANIPRWADYVIGGLQMSGNLTWSSGLPFSVNYNECGSDTNAREWVALQTILHSCCGVYY